MKRKIKKIFLIGIAFFLILQLYQPERNDNYNYDLAYNFKNMYSTPKNVQTLLRTSCYDCHSNNTEYPWYSYIQPVRFFMDTHINEGKKELNFNEFGTYSNRKQKSKLEEIIKQIKSNEMPLTSSTMIHHNAILNKENKTVLINWLERTKDSLSKIN